MNRFPKGLSITGGIFAVLCVLVTTFSAVVNIIMVLDRNLVIPATILLLVRMAATVIQYLLLAIVLFRGKKDKVTGILLLVRFVTRATTLSWLNGLQGLLDAALAVDCFVDFPMEKKLRLLMLGGAGCVVNLLVLLQLPVSIGLRSWIYVFTTGDFVYVLSALLACILNMTCSLCLCFAIAATGGQSRPASYNQSYSQPYQGYPQQGAPQRPFARDPKEYGYISMVTHVLLLLFTFGIWGIIWIYKTTELLNRVPGSQKFDPVAQMLLYMFVPYFYIYWFYKQSRRTDAFTRLAGIFDDCGTVGLILGIFLPLGAMIFLQSSINKASQVMAR